MRAETTPAGAAKSREAGGSGCSSESRVRISETICVGTMLPVLLITALPSKLPAHAPTVYRGVAPMHQRFVNSLDVPDLNMAGHVRPEVRACAESRHPRRRVRENAADHPGGKRIENPLNVGRRAFRNHESRQRAAAGENAEGVDELDEGDLRVADRRSQPVACRRVARQGEAQVIAASAGSREGPAGKAVYTAGTFSELARAVRSRTTPWLLLSKFCGR